MDRITFIIHTYNRPHFLIRLVRYFDSVAAMRGAVVIIADGSSDEDAAPFDEWLAAHPVGFDLTVRRHPGTTLMERLGLALETIDTPYVILGADDDLYFFDWIETAVGMMDAEADLGVVFGDFMLFELDGFIPYSDAVRFDMPTLENPPLAWLEGASAAERLAELGRQRLGLASAGWYALQRTELLATIVSYGRRFQLEPLMFERFLVVAQAASAKTRMLPRLLGARQVDPGLYRAPFQQRGNEARIAALTEGCAAYLVAEAGFNETDARQMTQSVLFAELNLMQTADRKRHLRSFARVVPFVRTIWRWLKPVTIVDLLRDERLPPSPDADDFKSQQAIVEGVIRQQAAETRP